VTAVTTLASSSVPALARPRAAALTPALDALLENVFGHTPDGGPPRVEVVAPPEGDGRVIAEDGGPG
jgi:hypothetical protein